MDAAVSRRCFSVDEYQRMGEAGILHEDEHVELIEGDVITMAAIGGRHIGCVIWLTNWFSRRVGDTVLVSTQNPVRLSARSEPEPDVAVLRSRADDYRSGPPRADDVLLLIEVADSSLVYDRDTKLPLYAAAGIPEAWLVDLDHDLVTVYRDPAHGAYQSVTSHARGVVIAPLAFPHLTIGIDNILGS
jgi:Uma2 family endonuclease